MMNWRSLAGSNIPPCPVQMPQSLWTILHSRGLHTADQIQKLYSPELKDLTDPFALLGMQKAVERLTTALTKNEKVAIYADYDLDGSPGAVLLKCGLERLGFKDVLIRQPKRLSDGYGVHPHILDELKAKFVSLVVTVDVGITDVEAVDHANSIGMDVIVTDHHLPKEVLPRAVAIVNPNQNECTSGLGHLCGTGVAFYVVMAVKRHLNNQSANLKDLLDLFALATVTDLVPLVKENRTLVKHGLRVLMNTQRPGLAILMENLGLRGKEIAASDIGFKLAPKLNALSRLEEDIFPVDLMLADHSTAEGLVQKVLSLNDKRRTLQEIVYADALKQIDFQAQEQAGLQFVSVFSESYHPGVISVVANKLIEKYQVPAFVGAIRSNGVVIGSARSPSDSIDLQNVLGSAAPILHRFGGHKLAAGFETSFDQLNVFKSSLDDYFRARPQTEVLDTSIAYDAELKLNELTASFMKWHSGLEPFGMGFEEPIFLVRGVRVKQLRQLKGDHLKLQVAENGYSMDAIWFSARPSFALSEGQVIDLLVRPSINEWQGQKTTQLLITTARPG